MDDGTINFLGATRAAASETAEAVAETLTGAYIGDRGEGSDMGRTAPPLGAWLERLGGRNYWVAPDAFFQVNTAGAEAMLAEVVAGLPSRIDLLVDAHAGVGTFALALAGQAGRVLGYEMVGSSVASARWTAQVGSVSNAEFRQGPSERLFAALPDEVRPDAVVLDPPRSGCAPSLLREVLKREVPRIVYVSCDPSTLARDIKVLSAQYSLTSTRVIDMFPQTYHIESVSVLERL
jgi:23S rRNA (uracil1939-C5)-methyltransferase